MTSPTDPPHPRPPAYPQPPRPPDRSQPPPKAGQAPPSYPEPPAPPQQAPEPAVASSPAGPPPAGHVPPFGHGRVHLASRQRGVDATTVGWLVLHLPNIVFSLVVVFTVSLLFGGIGFVVIPLWLLSGVLVFHRPTEGVIARRVLRLRYPTLQECAVLAPVWQTVTARAGVDGRAYQLWVEDSNDLNAMAAAGHIVGVTNFALRLPPEYLAAILAHELGHHTRGHSWSSLLGYWYALPGRLTWRLLRVVAGGIYRAARATTCLGIALALIVGSLLLTVGVATLTSLYGLPLLLPTIPYLLAALSRRSELRADRHAAALGFAPELIAVLDWMHQAEEQARAEAFAPGFAAPSGPCGTAPGQAYGYATRSPYGPPHTPPRETALTRLLTSHPDHHTRLHHLQRHLDAAR